MSDSENRGVEDIFGQSPKKKHVILAQAKISRHTYSIMADTL